MCIIMNRFVILYCVALLIIIITLFLPKYLINGVVAIVLFAIFFIVLILIFATKEGKNTDTQIMTALLIPLWLKTISDVVELSNKDDFDSSHMVAYAQLIGKHRESAGHSGYNYYLDFQYNNYYKSIFVNSDDYYNDSLFKSALLLISPHNKIINNQVSDFEKRKFKYPVEYRNNLEYGNDSYDYCFIEPYTALNNFGLRRVTKSIDNSDTILYYKNLNHTIDSVAHRLADTLQTASNRALLGSSFAFLFHDGIYTKEQVFEEIPQAKEYYLKYCKDEDTSSVNILRNH